MLAEAGQPAVSKEQNLYDALSQSSNAYVAKHGTAKPKRMQSANASSKNGSRFSKGTKTYYPDEYYKRVGYQMSESSSKHRVDALGQRVRERFNEELSYTDHIKSRGIDKRQLVQLDQERKGLKQTPSQTGMSVVSKQDLQSRTASSAIRKRRNTANAYTADAVIGELFAPEKKEKDALSVITHDRLKKFNEFQGTVAGNAYDEILAQEAAELEAKKDVEGEVDAEELKDVVGPIPKGDE